MLEERRANLVFSAGFVHIHVIFICTWPWLLVWTFYILAIRPVAPLLFLLKILPSGCWFEK